jgi:hypothetical protein
MFTPRGVTKRLSAAVTGYYVLLPLLLKLLLLLLLLTDRLSQRIYFSYFIRLRSGIRDVVMQNIIQKNIHDIIFYLSSRPLRRRTAVPWVGGPWRARGTLGERVRNPHLDPTALYPFRVHLVSKKRSSAYTNTCYKNIDRSGTSRRGGSCRPRFFGLFVRSASCLMYSYYYYEYNNNSLTILRVAYTLERATFLGNRHRHCLDKSLFFPFTVLIIIIIIIIL